MLWQSPEQNPKNIQPVGAASRAGLLAAFDAASRYCPLQPAPIISPEHFLDNTSILTTNSRICGTIPGRLMSARHRRQILVHLSRAVRPLSGSWQYPDRSLAMSRIPSAWMGPESGVGTRAPIPRLNLTKLRRLLLSTIRGSKTGRPGPRSQLRPSPRLAGMLGWLMTCSTSGRCSLAEWIGMASSAGQVTPGTMLSCRRSTAPAVCRVGSRPLWLPGSSGQSSRCF
jgi:hypothetical protein